ncbi:UNVERIFIED_ORG: choline-sulfatase [Pseudomonas mohnii]|uniref:sulfatase-like hydrolase/transferase n=1 Tax=Pseudomonas sp. GW101-3H06 TaxID=2751347 RepID=UPI001A92893F|nr:sulfatase-like hydrolase/transferase [Pseudomonas sp. GW101-3H06]MDP9691336.1 choline-sulfatase [Pseudomonas mohnii]
MTKAKNLIVFMSDEHNPKALGCYGNDFVKTPNLDAIAATGTRFTSAYCNSPVCIPARATFATGRYIHQMGFWDNADPYDGSVTSWHHRVRDEGQHCVSIGKLHFRSIDDDNGFSQEIVPMHVIEGKGDLMGLVREDLPRRGGAWKMAGQAGPGESSYTMYDRNIAALAQTWLREEAPKHQDKPWVLFVSFVAPHFPLTAPPEHFYRYYLDDDLPWPKLYDKAERPDHPFIKDYASSFAYDDFFDTEDKVRRALAGYYGLVSFLDENIGKVMSALEGAGLRDDTRIIYTSDHGDNLGSRGLWGKSTMFEEAVGVPLIISGDGLPAGVEKKTPITHIDVYPTILEAVGIAPTEEEKTLSGESLFKLANQPDGDRLAFAEYHGMGSATGAFMIRDDRYKYVHYVDYPPHLFDLLEDPEELLNLAEIPGNEALVAEYRAKMETLCIPKEVDARARKRQAELLELNGGREAVVARGDLGYSPPPGVAVDFN